MKLPFLLGSFAILVLVSACGGQHAGAPSPGDGTGGVGDTGGSTGGSTNDGRGHAGGSGNSGQNAAGAAQSGGSSHAGTSGSGGSVSETSGHAGAPASDGQGNAGTANRGEAGAPDSGEGDAGAPGNEQGDAGAPDSGDNAAGATGDDGNGATGGSGGLANVGGSGGLAASGGSAGLANGGGSGGLASSGGSGGASNTGGSGDVSASGGSGDVSPSGGSGDVSASGGSGGLPGSAGAGGSPVVEDGQYLFTTEQFGGNGRTCVSCHTAQTGTVSPDQIQALYASNPDDPLFRSVDSDDGAGTDYTELQAHATFRVSIPLPSGVFLTSDPTATSIVLRRSVPSTINTPALDTVLMWDGREPDVEHQALDAVLGHAQGTVTPTSDQLELIAQYEQGPTFFSSDLLRDYAGGGTAPTWPAGTTDSEQRGRRWFAQDSAAPRFNICGQCHGGPMANTTQSNSGLPVGKRFQTVNVSEFNDLGNPTYEFSFPDPNHAGQRVTVTTPDPGRALITGDVRDVNFFKIPSLWGVKNTAPYFHDNSAATLEDLMDHYEKHLATFLPKNGTYPTPHVPTAQDKADIIAYLQLL